MKNIHNYPVLMKRVYISCIFQNVKSGIHIKFWSKLIFQFQNIKELLCRQKQYNTIQQNTTIHPSKTSETNITDIIKIT